MIATLPRVDTQREGSLLVVHALGRGGVAAHGALETRVNPVHCVRENCTRTQQSVRHEWRMRHVCMYATCLHYTVVADDAHGG